MANMKTKTIAFRIEEEDFKIVTAYFDERSMNKSEWLRKQIKAIEEKSSK